MSETTAQSAGPPPSAQGGLAGLLQREKNFLLIFGTGVLAALVLHPYPHIAMWVGFVFAAYSAIANDSIQTIGTFLASNSTVKWQVLWVFVAGIFLLTSLYSFMVYNGDVSHQRLTSKGFDEAPTSFRFLQLAAPLVLMLLTRMRMPVSTTFLLLSCFATTPEGIGDMMVKSFTGYFVAFAVGIFSWAALSRVFRRLQQGEPHPGWRVAQWMASGALWSVWLMQDMANIAVFLPRQLNWVQFTIFVTVIILGLGVLLRMRGDRIQQVITEKKNVIDVRAATMLDLIYACVLYYFKSLNPVPMSTTWVFIGLLAGRELAMALTDVREERRSMRFTLRLVGKDLLYATIGMVISLVMAASVNDTLRAGILGWFGIGAG